ncbi:MAG TPA: hypothetical protein VF611_06290 [Pyrinomonadaceae bacterium]|jgi:hypothetical protein
MSPEDPKLALQVRVSKMLGCGFAFSLVVSGGVGSLAALVIGLRARGIIRKSGGELSGMRVAWWCIIVGGLGAAMLPLLAWRFIGVVSR